MAPPIARAWARLAAVERADESSVDDAILVLRETLPCPSERIPRRFEEPPLLSAPRSTAAHPRGFRGTTAQPPKPPTGALGDVRIWLCHSPSIPAVLAALQTRVPRHPVWKELRPAQNVYALHHHGEANPADWPHLPQEFVEDILPCLRGRPWSDARVCLGAWRTLGMAEDARLRAAIARLLVGAGAGDSAAGWIRLMEQVDAAARLQVVEALIDTKVSLQDIDDAHEALRALQHQGSNLLGFLDGRKQGYSSEFLLSTIRLVSWLPELPTPAREVPLQPLGEIADLWDTPFSPMLGLWRAYIMWDKFPQLIASTDWRRFGSEIARIWLKHYAFSEPHSWTALCTIHVDIVRALESTAPDYREKLLDLIYAYIGGAERQELTRRDPGAALTLAARLSRSPFAKQCWWNDPTQVLLSFGADTLPDSSLLQLEKSFRKDSDTYLIGKGLDAMSFELPAFTRSALLDYPSKSARLAKLLGSFRSAHCRVMLKNVAQHPLLCDVTDVALPSWLATHLPAKLQSPVTRKLRDHLSGTRPLSEVSLHRAMKDLRHRMVLTQLDFIELQARETLAAGTGLDAINPDVVHALRLLRQINLNRRALRSVLQALSNGRDDYVWEHHETARWRLRHPRLDTAVWREGIVSSCTHPRHGSLVLKVEQRPFEILKLGTYVGSCFGLGGSNAESAAAVLLDANKRVVYARTAQGAVAGRQIVALSTDDRLVTYRVYPSHADAALRAAFKAWDDAFAQALRIERCTSDDYFVEQILSNDWWDDGQWQKEDT